MLELAKWYLLIGVCMSIYVFLGFLLVRHRIENPVSFSDCVTTAGVSVFLWPVCFISIVMEWGSMAHLVTERPFPFSSSSLEEAIDRNQEEKNEVRENPPVCGEYVCANGLDDPNYKYTAATFIFKSSELVEQLSDDPLNESGSDSEEARIVNWLCHRDYQLSYCAMVPKVWKRMSYVITKAIEQGVGECYCPECSTSYAVTELHEPDEVRPRGIIYKTFHCPNNHLVHKTESIRFIF